MNESDFDRVSVEEALNRRPDLTFRSRSSSLRSWSSIPAALQPTLATCTRLSGMAVDDPNATTTRLLTLLNVSATKAGKRKRNFEENKPSEKLNKKRTVQIAAPEETLDEPSKELGENGGAQPETEQEEGAPGGEVEDEPSAYAKRFRARSWFNVRNVCQKMARTPMKRTLACSLRS